MDATNAPSTPASLGGILSPTTSTTPTTPTTPTTSTTPPQIPAQLLFVPIPLDFRTTNETHTRTIPYAFNLEYVELAATFRRFGTVFFPELAFAGFGFYSDYGWGGFCRDEWSLRRSVRELLPAVERGAGAGNRGDGGGSGGKEGGGGGGGANGGRKGAAWGELGGLKWVRLFGCFTEPGRVYVFERAMVDAKDAARKEMMKVPEIHRNPFGTGDLLEIIVHARGPVTGRFHDFESWLALNPPLTHLLLDGQDHECRLGGGVVMRHRLFALDGYFRCWRAPRLLTVFSDGKA